MANRIDTVGPRKASTTTYKSHKCQAAIKFARPSSYYRSPYERLEMIESVEPSSTASAT